MNLRKKAKHFKKLYENTLSKKPYLVAYETPVRKHYRVCKMVDEREIVYSQPTSQLLKNHIEMDILRELRPIIWDNLKSEHDLDGKITYSLDVWI